MSDIERWLQNQDSTRVSWVEPWPGVDADGNTAEAHMTISCSVRNAIKLQRMLHDYPDDSNALADFLAVHFAEIIE